MRAVASLVLILASALVAHHAHAGADRESLLDAWAAHVSSLPGTARMEALGNGVYRFEDTDLPYDGELRIVGALVRPADTSGYDTGFSHLGMVDIELPDLPVERMSSQVYYYWLSDRQAMHYSTGDQRWVDPATYQATVAGAYRSDGSFGAMAFMMNYGIWAFLIALIVFVFLIAGRQARKARSLMDETAEINRKARENLDRAEGLQDELLAIARESRDLQSSNNELLAKILGVLNR